MGSFVPQTPGCQRLWPVSTVPRAILRTCYPHASQLPVALTLAALAPASPPARLVSDEIMELVNPSARMVYVGKAAGYHTRRQEEIHELLLAFAEAGGSREEDGGKGEGPMRGGGAIW